MRVASVLVGLVAAAAGCSLVVGTDGLSAGTSGGAPTDAGGGDASTTNDGGQDALADASDAGTVTQGCRGYPDATFCQDFDDETTAFSAKTWSSTDAVGDPGGTLTLVGTGAVSPPNAARFSLLDAGDGCEYLSLDRTFTGAFSSLTTRVSVRPEGTSTFFGVIAAPKSTASQPTYRVLLGMNKTGANTLYAFVQKFTPGNGSSAGFSDFTIDSFDFDTAPFGRTLDLSVEITASPIPKIVVHEGARALVLTAPADLIIDNPRIEIGQYCQKAPSTFTFDDVVVWLKP